MERLDQAFRQSYYHTQRPHGQPFGACAETALGGKMRAITLDFKESHHGRTLPYKRTDPRIFRGAFSGGAVSGHSGKISAECASVLTVFGWSACHEGYRKAESLSESYHVRSLKRGLIFAYCDANFALPETFSLVTAVRFLNGQEAFPLTTAAQNMCNLCRKSPLCRNHFFEWLKTENFSNACGRVTLKSPPSRAFFVPDVHL